jgi:hypothetical protein
MTIAFEQDHCLYRQTPDQRHPDWSLGISIGKVPNVYGQDWVQFAVSTPGQVRAMSVSPAEARATAQWILDNVPEV